MLKLNAVPFPVPVDRWIEHPLGFTFGVQDLSRLGQSILGAAFVREREILVSDAIESDARFRFTCAHELGHMILHARSSDPFTDVEVGDGNDRLEREADRFATAFLMPLPSVVDTIFGAFQDSRLDPRACFGRLVSGGTESDWLLRKRLLPVLTRRFGVSLSTAVYRLTDIIVVGKLPLITSEHADQLLLPASADDPSHAVRVVAGTPVLDTAENA